MGKHSLISHEKSNFHKQRMPDRNSVRIDMLLTAQSRAIDETPDNTSTEKEDNNDKEISTNLAAIDKEVVMKEVTA